MVFVLAVHAGLLWTVADTGLWVWSIGGFLGLLAALGIAGMFRPSSDSVSVVRGVLAVATAVLVGEATGSLTTVFWPWFMALALIYPVLLPSRAAAGAVLMTASAYGLTIHAGTAAFPLEDALLRAGVLGAIGLVGLGLGMMLNRLLGDREEAESRVREVQGVLDAAFDTASSGMALLGLDGEILQANQALADFLGRSVESLLGTGWGALIEPQERQHYTKQVTALVEGGVWSFQAETRFVLRDRRIHFGLVGMSLVTDGAGRARYIFAHVTNITSRVRGELKVRKSEAHYRNLFDLAPVPLFQIDLTAAAAMLDVWRSNGVGDLDAHLDDADQFAGCSSTVDYLALNEAARRLFRATGHTEFIAGAMSGALGPGYGDFIREVLRALWDRKDSMETGAVILDLSGGVHEGMARLAIPDVDGRPEYARALLTFADHTETLRSRSELASVERRMRAVMSDAPIVLFAVDHRGVFTLSEGQGLASLGLTPGEVVGRSAYELYRDVPEVESWIRSALDGESTMGAVKVGDLVFQTRFSPIRDGEVVVGVMGVAVDISEQSRANDLLTEVVRSKDRFVATVSHELRTPLTAVVGFAHELRRRLSDLDRAEVATYVDMIRDQAIEVGDLVEDLLVASRSETAHMSVAAEPVDLWAQIDAVLAARTLEATLTVERSGSDAKVVADPMRVRQIIRNLLINADRHGGEHVTVRVVPAAESVSLFVIDDGAGVAEEERAAMFEPYHRIPTAEHRSESVGLGLTVSRSLARMMGGDLTYGYYRQHSFFELRLPTA
ncbi:MAG: PAS domain-containing protein [Actinomycetota bacterium]